MIHAVVVGVDLGLVAARLLDAQRTPEAQLGVQRVAAICAALAGWIFVTDEATSPFSF